jgi:hypothetical protein
MSASKRRGTAAESAVVAFLREAGFVQVERRALGGARDRGDIAGLPGVVIEVKDTARMELGAHLAEALKERDNDGAQIGALWHKRRGKGSPGDWFVTVDGATFVTLLRHFMGLEPLAAGSEAPAEAVAWPETGESR